MAPDLVETGLGGVQRHGSTAEAESLALPYLWRVVEQEGGSIGFRTVIGAPGAGAMLSAVTSLGGQSARNLPKTGIAN